MWDDVNGRGVRNSKGKGNHFIAPPLIIMAKIKNVLCFGVYYHIVLQWFEKMICMK